MPRITDKGYLVDLLNQCYSNQEDNWVFLCVYCKKAVIVEEELREKI